MYRLTAPFEVDIQQDSLNKVTATGRVLFGLGLVHHFLDLLGFLVVLPQPASAAIWIMGGIVLSLLLVFGLFTPLALIGLLIYFVKPPVVNYLGYQIAIITTWALLLLSAGRTYSLDALLMHRTPLRTILKPIYRILPLPTHTQVAYVRYLMIFMYWGISFGAMRFHFTDPLWLKGDVLQLVLTTPYLTDFYHFFTAFRDAAPKIYDVIWSVGLLIQVVWEILLLPLMYFRWGRIFVATQGITFFVFSLIFLNLGYLPYFELMWWLILFGPSIYSTVIRRQSETPQLRVEGDSSPFYVTAKRIFHIFVATVSLILVTYMLIDISRLFQESVPPQVKTLHSDVQSGNLRTYFRIFAQGQVNVFNQQDLQMGSAFTVISEVDDTGELLRVVPFIDGEGGRLNYLRNDLLYFPISLRWQRSTITRKLSVGDEFALTDYSRDVVTTVMLLDTCLTGRHAPRYYRVDFFQREMIDTPDFVVWSRERLVGSAVFVIDDQDLVELQKRESSMPVSCFDLPPGHWLAKQRQEKTRELISSLEPIEPP